MRSSNGFSVRTSSALFDFDQTVEQAVARRTEVTLATPGVLRDDLLDLLRDRVGAVDRGAFRQLDFAEDRALVLRRQEAGRRDLEQPAGAAHDDQHDMAKAARRTSLRTIAA